MSKKFYLAGPMTGIAQFNFPAFDAAAADLRARGYDIVSPAELDDPETRDLSLASKDGMPNGKLNGQTWADFLARDVKLIGDQVAGIILLPEWWKSRGARLESFVGLLSSLKFARYTPQEIGGLTPISSKDILSHIVAGFAQ